VIVAHEFAATLGRWSLTLDPDVRLVGYANDFLPYQCNALGSLQLFLFE
jgi:hypothetical protein